MTVSASLGDIQATELAAAVNQVDPSAFVNAAAAVTGATVVAGLTAASAATIAIPGTTYFFWSGLGAGTVAQATANQYGGSVMSLPQWTPALLTEYASSLYSWTSGGLVQVIQASEVSTQSVWATTEYPILISNPRVTGITYIIIDSTGQIVNTYTELKP